MKETLKQRIYNAIWDGIVNGEYPAEYVFNEKALVEKFHVSKSPVRDALIELCSDGILRSIPRYGYEIVKITSRDLQDITRIRSLIELENLNSMVGRLSPEQIAQVKAQILQVDQMLQAGSLNVRQHWENNMAFHKLLYRMSNNQFGASLLERCLKAETVAYSTYCLYGTDQCEKLDTSGHWAIIKCLEAGDREGTLEALRSDLAALQLR